MIGESRSWSLIAAIALSAASPAVQKAGGCQAAVPADFDKKPAHWLGACLDGHAEGLGVMRAGTGEPFELFIGEMRAGAPVKGILKLVDGWQVVTRFDAAHRNATPRSGDPNENHAVFLLAARAATATAERFAAAGNQGSAAYYRRLAKQIRDGEPE